MASTVTPATATVQIVESLTLGGVDRGAHIHEQLTNVAEADRRVYDVRLPLTRLTFHRTRG
jgi:hypothetical protein